MKKIEYIYEKQKDYGYIKTIEIYREIDMDVCQKYNVTLITCLKF